MRRIIRHIIRNLILTVTLGVAVFGQVIILSPDQGAVTSLHHVAVTVAGKPGAQNKLFMNGEPVTEGQFRIDGLYDFLNVVVPDGPVTLRVEAIGAGDRLFAVEKQIHVLGPVSRIIPYEADIRLPADGRTTRTLRFEIQDEWGFRLENIPLATVSLPAGSITEPDLDQIVSGTQLAVQKGLLELTILAPDRAQRTLMEVSINGFQLQVPVQFTTPREPFMLVGSFHGVAQDRGKHDVFRNGMELDFAERTGSDEFTLGSRSAFYARGGIGRNFRLTTGYDSQRRPENQFFEEVDPDLQYPIYGDASRLEYDAQSTSKLFARLEHNQSFILYGDYNTGMTATEFTAYNRTFNGLVSRLDYKGQSLTSFGTLSDLKPVLDEIRGQGISGYYNLGYHNITVYTEKITLEVRDRYHPETIVKSVPQVRYQDYDIDYDDGTLMFKQPVASIGAAGNPVYIVASYEYKSGSPEVFIGGLRYQGQLGRAMKIGSTFITEDRAPASYTLYGIDGILPVTNWLSLKGELAYSNDPTGEAPDDPARAYKMELLANSGQHWVLKGYYRDIDRGFVNPSQTRTASELGAEKYGVAGELKLPKYGFFASEYYQQFYWQSDSTEVHNRVLSTSYRNEYGERLKYRLSYENALRERLSSDSGLLGTTTSESVVGKLDYQLTGKWSGTVERNQNLSGQKSIRPSSTALGLVCRLTASLKFFSAYTLTDDSDIPNSTVLGFESNVMENTQVQGKYEIGGAIGQSRNRASIGLKNKWQVRDDLLLNFTFENTATVDSFEVITAEHSAMSIGFDYLPERPWKSSGRYEYYKAPDQLKQALTSGASFKLGHRLSVLIKGHQMWTTFAGSEKDYQIRGEYQIGMAYRPDYSDALNWIGKVEYKTDANTHVEPDLRLDRMLVAVHAYWQPLRWLEFGGRVASRQVLSEEGEFYHDRIRTDLVSLRTEIGIGLKWSTALDLRYLDLPATQENQTGSAVEIDYLVHTNMQLGVGYILQNYEDADFAYLNRNMENFFLAIHAKFSENIFNWK